MLNRKDLKTLINLKDFITWLTCHDFRKEAPGTSRVSVYKNIKRLEKKFAAHHIRDTRIFRLILLVAELTNKEYIRKILDYIDSRKARTGFDFLPAYNFISSVSVLMTGRAIVTYYIPHDFIKDILTDILFRSLYEKASTGSALPVHNCCSLGDIECTKKMYYKVLDAPKIDKSHLLDFIITSVLDNNPYSRLRDIANVAKIAEARFLELLEMPGISDRMAKIREHKLRYKFVLKRYQVLSSYGVVGRILVYMNNYIDNVRVVILGPRECASRIYGVVAAYLGSPRIIITENDVIAGATLPTSAMIRIGEELSGCKDVRMDIPVSGWIYPLPFEYYDPFQDKWVKEPVDIYKIFRRMGLLERHIR